MNGKDIATLLATPDAAELLTMESAAARVGLNYYSLSRLNGQGRGPDVAVKIGYARFYRASDVDSWASARKVVVAAA